MKIVVKGLATNARLFCISLMEIFDRGFSSHSSKVALSISVFISIAIKFTLNIIAYIFLLPTDRAAKMSIF